MILHNIFLLKAKKIHKKLYLFNYELCHKLTNYLKNVKLKSNKIFITRKMMISVLIIFKFNLCIKNKLLIYHMCRYIFLQFK